MGRRPGTVRQRGGRAAGRVLAGTGPLTDWDQPRAWHLPAGRRARGTRVSASFDAWLRPSRTSQPKAWIIIKYSRRASTNRDHALNRRTPKSQLTRLHRVLERYKGGSPTVARKTGQVASALRPVSALAADPRPGADHTSWPPSNL